MPTMASGRAFGANGDPPEVPLGTAAWRTWRRVLLVAATSVMSATAAFWLVYELTRLLARPEPHGLGAFAEPGGVDLLQRHEEVHEWFGGVSLYGVRATAVYPPATYAMLWPFLGWLGPTAARWSWA